MTITIEKLKETLAKKGYTWENGLNIIGVRTTLQVPDMFNDVLCCVWSQPTMPVGLAPIDQQRWLNKGNFVGKDGKKLNEDGDFGANSQFALASYQAALGKEQIKMWTITTNPGLYWLNHPENKLGTAVLMPGQWKNCWSLGFHKNKPDHRALVQVDKITVYRDNDGDNIAEATSVKDTGLFGVNIHGSNKTGITPRIVNWSAGCQVFNNWINKEALMDVCELFRKERDNKFTYTLLLESELN